MKKSIVLGDHTFPSWYKVRQYHLELMRKHRAAAEPNGPPYQSIVRHDHKDYAFLKALFRQHTDCKEKLKHCTLHYFEFAPDEGDVYKNNKNWCCFVINVNGHRARWSAKHIGVSKHKKQQDNRKAVFRMEISGQRDQFAAKHPWVVPCAECNTHLRNTKSQHPKTIKIKASLKRSMRTANVDHDVDAGQAFIETFEAFEKKLGTRKLQYTWTKRYNRHVQVLENRDLARAWRRYHKKHTVFRFLCTTCNNQSHNKAKRKK